jgi:signal transduction histidine kinase
MTSKRDMSFGLALTGSFAAVVVAFTAATLYSETRGRGVDDAALLIATTAAPTIEHLSAARSLLSQLRVAEREYVDAVRLGDAPPDAALATASAALRTERRAYEGMLPPAKRPSSWQDAAARMNGVDEATEAVLAAGTDDGGSLDAADDRFRAAASSAGEALNASIAISAQRTRGLALRIEAVSTRMRRLTFLLNVVCGLATALAAALLARTLRRHRRLHQAHQDFLENRSHELEAFAGRVAHDIRNALTGISLTIQQAQRTAGSEPVAGALARSLRHVERMARISDGLLGFARAGAHPEPGGRAEVLDVVLDVVSAHRPEAAAAAIDIDLQPEAVGAVACTPGVLSSMVGNLLGNAVKHMGESERRRIVVRAVERDRFVRVEVDDSGPGLPLHLRAAVFEPYVRAAGAGVPGIGLGLATVKRLAEGHGGRVGAEPIAAGGSRFWFELPRPGLAPLEWPANAAAG